MPADFDRINQWLAAMRQDRDAFAALYAEMSRPMYTVAARILNNRADAEDAVQEAFLKMLQKQSTDDIQNGRAYILQTVRNEALMILRKRSHEELREEMPDERPDGYAWESDVMIKEAIGKLSPTERDIVTLHINGELTFVEIAGIINMSLPAVYRRYRKAQKKLRRYMNGGSL